MEERLPKATLPQKDDFWQKIIWSLKREKSQFLTTCEKQELLDKPEFAVICIYVESSFPFQRKFLTTVYYIRHVNIFLYWMTKLFKVSLLKSATICLQERKQSCELLARSNKSKQRLDICLNFSLRFYF